MNKKVVCRAAPSPTSPYGLHVGNIRTILFNYLFAKQNGGTFYLRIEDTDQDRFCPGAEDLIRKSLEWIGMEPDFAPWTEHPFGSMRQSERDYSKYLKQLLDSGNAYYAFDTKDEIDALKAGNRDFSYNHAVRDGLKNSLTLDAATVQALLDAKTPHVVRFKVVPNVIIKHNDIIRGAVEFNSNEMDDKVLLKSNGIGSYHLCNVCDDHDMGTGTFGIFERRRNGCGDVRRCMVKGGGGRHGAEWEAKRDIGWHWAALGGTGRHWAAVGDNGRRRASNGGTGPVRKTTPKRAPNFPLSSSVSLFEFPLLPVFPHRHHGAFALRAHVRCATRRPMKCMQSMTSFSDVGYSSIAR